jgi:hypothetical protein
MSKIYLEILDKERKLILEKLKNFSSVGYLAGGTALSLQISHRLSLDFDFFVEKPLKRTLIKKCQEVFGQDIQVIYQTADQLTFLTPTNIKIDFVYYWYPLISPLIKTPFVNLASISDIAADKAETVGRRATWRDYVDIFFILKWGLFSLKEIVALAKKKFGGEFNELLFLEQLVFFKDLEMTEIKFFKEKYSESKIKRYLEKKVEEFLNQTK